MRLVSEFRRRNVFRMAVLYAVAAWLIVQVAGVLIDLAKLPDWIGTTTLWLLAIGFPFALIFSWFYELTPEGISLEKDVDPEASITHVTGRRLDFVVISLLCAAVVLLAYDKWWKPVRPQQSIAVLPFQSRSTDPDDQLFADGIHDDLLTRLANISVLKVISRTSVMEYRNTKKNLTLIANELGVGTVMEGAVQRVGNNVRINAQLIDAATDEHLWAKTYDRPFSVQNVFAIQSEISEEIADALRATLTSDEQSRLAKVPTENMDAYNKYIRGRANLYKRRLEAITQAREQFEQAIELDPNYAEAYAGLAESVILLFVNHRAIPWEEMLSVAEAALDKAQLLDPDLADGYASLGLLKVEMWRKTRTGPEQEEAEVAFLRAIKLNSNHAQAYMWFASLRMEQERFDEAIKLYQQSLQVDPLARIPYLRLSIIYARLGRNNEALTQYVEAVEIFPDWPNAYISLSFHLYKLGRLDEAVAWGLKGLSLSTDPWDGFLVQMAFFEIGEIDRARSILADFPTDHPLYWYIHAWPKVLDGDFAGAIAFLEDMATKSDHQPPFLLSAIAEYAVLAGDYEKARLYAERSNPEFAADADPTVDEFNVVNVVRYAFILQQQGENQRADSLLAAALPLVRSLPRTGSSGYGIIDVDILALQGRPFEALATMREAIDEGFRGTLSFNLWPLSLDPYLNSIRDRPEFLAQVREIDDAVLLMRERVLQAEASGDWEELLALARLPLRP